MTTATRLRPCPHCDNEVALSARRCPRCGGRQPQSRRERILVMALVTVVLGAVLAVVLVHVANNRNRCADLRAQISVANITGDDAAAADARQQLADKGC